MLTFRTVVNPGFRASSALWNETALKVWFGTTAPEKHGNRTLAHVAFTTRVRLAQDSG